MGGGGVDKVSIWGEVASVPAGDAMLKRDDLSPCARFLRSFPTVLDPTWTSSPSPPWPLQFLINPWTFLVFTSRANDAM
jgi:hypothetical protein